MKAQLDFRKASPEANKAMNGLHTFVHNCGLARQLLELVKLRASQINGCAHCIDVHTKELRVGGDSDGGFIYSMSGENPRSTARGSGRHLRGRRL